LTTLNQNEAAQIVYKKKQEALEIDKNLYVDTPYTTVASGQSGSAGSAGRKDDQGKIQAAIIFEDFPLALRELMKVATFGAQKYSRAGWKTVKDRQVRYADAKVRHQIDGMLEDNDGESDCDHLAHEAWNTLALLQMKLENNPSG
jgi:hypothetical protein